jgi:hypothetical protein
MSMEEYKYESEYQAPEYSIVDKKIVGKMVITTVIMDGDWEQFETPLNTFRAGQELEDK